MVAIADGVKTGRMSIRDVSLYVDIVGQGYPLLLMHGGPGADHWTLRALRRCADRFTMVFYDHRCNGRSDGAVSSMTWDNLTADADALRERLGIQRWAVLGHSFGGCVALEYALRYPDRLSHLILLDTGADSRWWRENALEVLRRRGYSRQKVELVRRWFAGEFQPGEFMPILMRIGGAYAYRPILGAIRTLVHGGWRTKTRPEALIFAGRHLLKDWSVTERLGEIAVPTLVIAGVHDFLFPPECQRQLAAGLPNAQLELIERAGHNPHDERPAAVMPAIRRFFAANPPQQP